jgi:hypothetical protein
MPRRGEKQDNEHIYRIAFLSQGNAYEVYARQVTHGGLLGFVEVEDLLFQERSQVVIDPNEDRLRSEFEGVRRFFVPIHSVLRIDEVARRGTARITAAPAAATAAAAESAGKVSPFPLSSLHLPVPPKSRR